MEKYNIELSKDEITTLLQLIDVAVQSKGLQVAEVAVYFHNKFRQIVINNSNEEQNKK